MKLAAVTPDPTGLKALAHPVRLTMLGLLRAEGPATATSLAARLGINSGATSYHLRQLAQHGFIVEDEERGNRRERWWRAAHQATRTTPAGTDDADAREAHDAFAQAVAAVHADQLQRAADERPSLPGEWLASSTLSDWILRLSPARAEALVHALVSVIEATPEEDESGADFVIQLQAFPRPGILARGETP